MKNTSILTKFFSTLAVCTLVSSCSSISPANLPIKKYQLQYEYYGARNELLGNPKRPQLMSQTYLKETPEEVNHHIHLGVSKFVTCNKPVTDCKHAAVKSDITYKVLRINDEFYLMGKFSTEIGRSVSVKHDNSVFTTSVPKGIEVAMETEQSKDFQLAIKSRDSVTVSGPTGDRAILKIVDNRDSN